MLQMRPSLLAISSLLATTATSLSPAFNQSYADGSQVLVQLVSADGGIVRITTVPSGASNNFLRYPLEVAQPPIPNGVGFNVVDQGTSWLLTINNTAVVVGKSTPITNFSRVDGAPLSSEVQPVSAEPESQCGGGGHGGPIVGGCLRAWRSLQANERIYGFGVQFTGVDHTGTTKFIRTGASPDDTGLAHIVAPFFVSSLGYGVAVNTHGYSYYDIGVANPSIHMINTPDPVADLYFFTGPSLRDVLAQYTQVYGRTSMPPQWALGQWYHPQEDSNQTVVESVVDAFASNDTPLAAVTLEPPWQTHSYSCTYVWSNKTFWDPQGFIKRLNGNGTEVTLWQHAYVLNDTVARASGTTSPLWDPLYNGNLSSNWITWGGATPDWTLPGTSAAVSNYFVNNFISIGIAAFKLDECDGVPPSLPPSQQWFFPDNSSWPSGFNGSHMHNIFALTYGFAYHRMFESQGMRTFLKARANYMGGQRYPTTTYSDTYDYSQYIMAVLNSGWGGWTWAPELRTAASASEFARRSEVMLFSGLSSEDGWDSGYAPFPPYVDPGSAAIYREYYQQRVQLIPTLYAGYQQQGETGVPLVRSLGIDWPADIITLGGVQDQYMLGSLIVAPGPIGVDDRFVYFPAGSGHWVDYFNPAGSPLYNASTNVSITCPDEILPVFQQAGTAVVLADLHDHTVLRLRAVAPMAVAGDDAAAAPLVPSAVAVIYDDDGRSLRYRTDNEYYKASASIGLHNSGSKSASASSLPSIIIQMGVHHAHWVPAWTSVRWEVAVPVGHPLRHVVDGATEQATPVLLECDGTLQSTADVVVDTASRPGFIKVTHSLPEAGAKCMLRFQSLQ